ncbi:MAG: aminotransferase class I/II-fold pyridoxal phosphate-dependent enzyme [Lachnospiraceae bacterium]|uniref:Aminotransferase class I/II-fold pyridoxal phosphate-dependent enzyme n=1 Tax=Candidatus Weimeria bifida TaxID=2599074 RepID=A0A6N7IX84_9FIRM|nr:aminotransferase class I/II-fold pyridoxal phosphate-dependent enzyme [Candidatus Weimeria bifida]RRF97216.1 MAG: aminotransferase class I/II-fold pyridoxal phosphate-dependent enzyme [Lachnospiraceae bacterium]
MQFHGGDVYRHKDIRLDFSINTNPLGVPPKVLDAARAAADLAGQYPDPQQEELKRKIADTLVCEPEEVLVGNGASELFLDIVFTFKPKKIGVVTPSFGGYKYAAQAVGAQLEEYPLKEKLGYEVDDDIAEMLDSGIDMLFLATPNNPTGRTVPIPLLDNILKHCQRKDILVVIDESFMHLCDKVNDYEDFLFKSTFDNVIRVSAFTKSFAMAGVRLGYLRAPKKLTSQIATHQSEWNVSIFAEKCGLAALDESDYLERSRSFLRAERGFVQSGFLGMGFMVFPGEADFLMIKTDIPLYDELLKREILIRDLKDFDGLNGNYYRIAIKDRPKNMQLLAAVQEIVNGR